MEWMGAAYAEHVLHDFPVPAWGCVLVVGRALLWPGNVAWFDTGMGTHLA